MTRKELKRLLKACNELIEDVEGIRSVRWAYEGCRLKDIKSWCHFYVTVDDATKKLEGETK